MNRDLEVNPEAASRVADVAGKHGYRPNELARSLQGRWSRTIGLVIADVSNTFNGTRS